jgi:hypothetical protein
MSLLFALVIVVVALELEAAEDTIDREASSSFVLLPGLGLLGGIDPIGSGLQENSHQRVGWLENRGAHQHFQLLHGYSCGLRGLEAHG